MRILSRYFVTRFLILFVAILLASMLAVAIVEMLLNFEDVLRVGKGRADIFTYLLLRIPSYYLRELVPISSFAAAFATVGLAAHWLESTAAKAGGVSPYSFIFPILAAAGVLSLVTFAVNETLVIHATQQWEQLERGDAGIVDFRRGSFWYHSGHTIYNIKEANREARTLRGVRIYNRDGRGRLLSSLHADSVQIEDSHHWFFEQATVYQFDPDFPAAPTRVEHHLNLRQSIADESEAALMAADADTLTLRTLLEYIDAHPSPERVRRLRADLHERLAEPFVTLLFALLAIPIGLRAEDSKTLAMPAVYGIVTVAAFYLIRGTTATLAGEGVLPATLAPWSLLGIFSLWGGWTLLRVDR